MKNTSRFVCKAEKHHLQSFSENIKMLPLTFEKMAIKVYIFI